AACGFAMLRDALTTRHRREQLSCAALWRDVCDGAEKNRAGDRRPRLVPLASASSLELIAQRLEDRVGLLRLKVLQPFFRARPGVKLAQSFQRFVEPG